MYAAVAVELDCQTTENCFPWIKPKCFFENMNTKLACIYKY